MLDPNQVAQHQTQPIEDSHKEAHLQENIKQTLG
jgi:hypothetical protein